MILAKGKLIFFAKLAIHFLFCIDEPEVGLEPLVIVRYGLALFLTNIRFYNDEFLNK